MDNPVRLLRYSLELTQTEFGNEIGLSRARIAQLEDGGRLGASSLLRMFDRYRVEIARLGLSHEDFLRVGEAA
jgi:transcriptional regulator with XRE-family HTH domain